MVNGVETGTDGCTAPTFETGTVGFGFGMLSTLPTGVSEVDAGTFVGDTETALTGSFFGGDFAKTLLSSPATFAISSTAVGFGAESPSISDSFGFSKTLSTSMGCKSFKLYLKIDVSTKVRRLDKTWKKNHAEILFV